MKNCADSSAISVYVFKDDQFLQYANCKHNVNDDQPHGGNQKFVNIFEIINTNTDNRTVEYGPRYVHSSLEKN